MNVELTTHRWRRKTVNTRELYIVATSVATAFSISFVAKAPKEIVTAALVAAVNNAMAQCGSDAALCLWLAGETFASLPCLPAAAGTRIDGAKRLRTEACKLHASGKWFAGSAKALARAAALRGALRVIRADAEDLVTMFVVPREIAPAPVVAVASAPAASPAS